MSLRLLTLAALLAASAGASHAQGAPAAPAAASRAGGAHRTPAPRTAWPAANFMIQWRIERPPTVATGAGGWSVSSGDAATGRSGFGAGAVVVGTAPPARPAGVRVANGQEAVLQLDHASTHLVYDLTWLSTAQSSSTSTSTSSPTSTPTGGGAENTAGSRATAASGARRSSGAGAQEVTVHAVDALRVTPHWSHGDSLSLDLEVRHAAPRESRGDAGTSRQDTLDLRTTLQLDFDAWQTVATLGEGGDELQVRVSRR